MRIHSRGSREQRRAWSRNAHAAKARRRMEGPAPDPEPERVPAGAYLGTLTWHGADGEVRRIVIRQGARANQIAVNGMRRSIGWDALMRHLRARLSVPKRQWRD